MKTLSLIRIMIGASAAMLLSTAANADHRYKHYHDDDYRYATYEDRNYDDYGRVIEARPIYRQVAIEVPSESCRVTTVAHEERRRNGDSFGGTVMGGLVGAAIGHQIGHGRGGATAVGGLIGASIGNEIGSEGTRVTRYHDEEVCSSRYHTEYEQRIVGYDVRYTYQGREYQTRTERHPGDRIPLDVNVRPRY